VGAEASVDPTGTCSGTRGGTGGPSCETGAMSIDVAPDTGIDGLRARVEKVIEVIRPAIQADEGDIVLHEVDEATGEVSVELVGACVTCPASDQTLKAGIERILKDRVDGVTSVHNVGATLTGDGPIGAPDPDEGTPVSL
jgi:Fe-S cluster biogenesis protein NfuA